MQPTHRITIRTQATVASPYNRRMTIRIKLLAVLAVVALLVCIQLSKHSTQAESTNHASETTTTPYVSDRASNTRSQNESLPQSERAQLPKLPEILSADVVLDSEPDGALCPIFLGDYCYQVRFGQTEYSQVWEGYSELSLEQSAESVLNDLYAEGWKLESSGFIDLFGDAWSCLVSRQSASGEYHVLIITIMPRQKYEAISADNPMVIYVVLMSTEFVEDR
ncbi:MAG: hypothetical protein FWD45_00465 [Coriobacteriia bacterium]|nr:hypothetical protein [Coriobacteriia bacterium]